jgi:hypothetical protein
MSALSELPEQPRDTDAPMGYPTWGIGTGGSVAGGADSSHRAGGCGCQCARGARQRDSRRAGQLDVARAIAHPQLWAPTGPCVDHP